MFGKPRNYGTGPFIRGFVGCEPPTPYEYGNGTEGLGVGVSNKAVRRSHAPPVDSYRGRQGIQVLRNLNSLEGGCFIPVQPKITIDPVAVNEVNYNPGFVPLYDPRKRGY